VAPEKLAFNTKILKHSGTMLVAGGNTYKSTFTFLTH
jgi:hypothetical protein